MKKLLVLASMTLVVAVLVAGLAGAFGPGYTPTVYASSLAGIQGAGVTGIQIQNLDASQSAAIVADFYNQQGGDATSITLPSTPAGSAANIYLPQRDELQNGAYAAIISADRQIAAIARTDWASTGGAAIYSNVQPGTEVSLPLAVKRYPSAAQAQTSLVSVQNTDPNAQASVTVELFKVGESDATKTFDINIPPGTSTTLDLGTHDQFLEIGDGFLGSMRFTSATPIGVQSFVDIETSQMAVYAFEGVPSEMAASTLYAPLFRKRQAAGGGAFFDTGISVVNPGTDAVDVDVQYIGTLGACAGQTYNHDSATIPGGSSVVFYQGPDSALDLKNNLPDNCVGSAVIEATGGNVLAIVNDSLNFTESSAAYNAVGEELGATKVALPLFRRNHTAANLITGIQAMNIGSGTANVTITFADSTGAQIQGCGSDCTQTVEPNGSANFYPPSIEAIPDNTFGSATIESDQPLAVIVNDFTLAGTIDAATYNGIKADVQ